MIGAGISFYGASGYPPNFFLGGNGKIYDGSFDYDLIGSFPSPERTQPFTIFMAIKKNVENINLALFTTFVAPSKGIEILILPTNQLRFIIQPFSGANRILVSSAVNSFLSNGYYTIALSYARDSNANNIILYINGIAAVLTVTNNALVDSVANVGSAQIGGRTVASPLLPFNGLMRQLEMINRVATPAEILAASNAGSFQAAGITNAEYLLAVDFNKTGTANLMTRSSTPSYTITAVGGAAYTQYLP